MFFMSSGGDFKLKVNGGNRADCKSAFEELFSKISESVRSSKSIKTQNEYV